MSLRPAPMALRRPISRVRSVTDTSMMFMMPMPPTSSEMAAMAPRNSVSVAVMLVMVLSTSAGLKICEVVRVAGGDTVPLAQHAVISAVTASASSLRRDPAR